MADERLVLGVGIPYLMTDTRLHFLNVNDTHMSFKAGAAHARYGVRMPRYIWTHDGVYMFSIV